MDTDYLVVLTAIATAEAGVALGRKLVEEGLAACVQVLPGGTAIYRWQGELHADPQAQLIIKTRQAVWPSLQARILALHGDEVPELLALPVTGGLPAYLRWLDEMTVPQPPGENLLYVEEEGGIHHESAWARRLPAALRFLLG
jgi:periplasmic divalent cation tolerance protein